MKPDKLLAEWFWTDRWMGSSAFLLPMEARGLYREMLTQAWRRGASLPNDHEAIRRAVGCTEKEWARAWPKISRYWTVEGDLLVNETQRQVYAETRLSQERAAQRGRKGAQATAQARAQALAQATLDVMPEHQPPSPSPSPEPRKNERTTDEPPGADWARRAADAYLEHHPKARVPGALFRALKPLVKTHGWPAVEVELRAYMRQVPIGRFSWDTQFAGCFGSWAKSGGAARQPVTAANDAVIDAFMRKVEGVQG